jgi:hypothetical protein
MVTHGIARTDVRGAARSILFLLWVIFNYQEQQATAAFDGRWQKVG